MFSVLLFLQAGKNLSLPSQLKIDFYSTPLSFASETDPVFSENHSFSNNNFFYPRNVGDILFGFVTFLYGDLFLI